MMKIYFLTIVFLGMGLAAFALTPTERLAQIDQLQVVTDLNFQLTITEYQGEKVVDTNTLWGWSKTNADQNKTLLAFVAPVSVKGRKMLMDGPVVYLLFPRTRNPIRLSPLQILLGQSSNGDVARTSFSNEYDVQAVHDEIRDKSNFSVFDLIAKPHHRGTAYRMVKLWVDTTTLLPKEAEFYGSDAAVLKRAWYSDYQVVDGRPIAHRLEIHDGADDTHFTVLEYSHFGTKGLSDGAFRAPYLASWIPEQPR